MANEFINALAGQNRQQAAQIASLRQNVEELASLIKAQADTPKWIEDLPGRRSAFNAPIDLSIPAASTSKVRGVHTVSTDGPFVVTAIAAFFKKTEGSYQGVWGPATAYDGRFTDSAVITANHGYLNAFDQPHIFSGDVEIIDAGSDRNWQRRPISSAVFSPQAGGVYVLPVAVLFGRNSTISVTYTPGVAVAYSGVVQIIMLGYKIVQGDTYQP